MVRFNEECKIDIYFDDHYGKLYERFDRGIAETFYYRSDHGIIKHHFIKRAIPVTIGGETYYDLVTPYGYGGPVIVDCDEEMKSKLIIQFYDSFSEYCRDNKIVSEFVRFHPIINNAADFGSLYNAVNIRKTLGTNLKDYEDPIQSEFSQSCRKNIRKALNKGVTFEVVQRPEHLREFKNIYYSTMDRNQASDYYYFDDQYFDDILSRFRENVVVVKANLEGNVIAQGLYFAYGKYIHIHLSGTLDEYLHLSPAYVLRYAIALWGKENGFELIHHGGGRSNSEEDGLYRFKKGFAMRTQFDFYTGKKIWNKAIYDLLCETVGVDHSNDFFPAYRGRRGE